MSKIFFLFFLTINFYFLSSQDANNSNTSACENSFFSKAKFLAWNLTRPSYLSNPETSSDLQFCKMYNNKTSCCNKKTDDEIAALFANYKLSLSAISSKRIKKMKGVFDQYANVSISDNVPNGKEAKDAIKRVINDIKSKWINTNKHLVSCARSAMKLSVGLLCTGCSTKNNSIHVGLKLGLSRKACLALSAGCYNLIQAYYNTSNSSKDDAMNLTDSITSFVGEEIPADGTSSESIFGDLDSDNASNASRILADNNNNNNNNGGPKKKPEDIIKEAKDKAKEVKDKVISSDYISKVCDEVKKIFINSTCLICAFDSAEEVCKTNPIIKQFIDAKKDKTAFEAFQKKSDYSISPAKISISLNSSSESIKIDFIFNEKKLNDELFKFILLKQTKPQAKLMKITNILNTISNKIAAFLKFYDNKNAEQVLIKKDEIKKAFNSSNLIKCVVDVLQNATKEASVDLFSAKLTFKIIFVSDGKSTINEIPLTSQYSIAQCYEEGVSPANILSGSCEKKICSICLDDLCFDQSFDFKVISNEELKDYNKNKGREQFDKDKSVSLKTGKKVPDFIILPNVTDLTNFNFKPPCENYTDCANWFCGKFLIGPLARIQKVYNPQDADGELDKEVDLNVKVGRILADGSDYEISIDSGVDFNEIASVSGVDLAVSIDGVSESSEAFVDNGSGNKDNGSFGSRFFFSLAILLTTIYAVLA